MPAIPRVPQHKHLVILPRVKALRVKRAEAGVTVIQMARDLGRSESHVCDVLNGRRTSEQLAGAIAQYFDVPVEELFIRVDLENPDQASAA